MKRKTLTLSSEFYEKLIHLEPETKHGVLDVVFDFFFAGKSFCYSDFSTDTKTALACIMPDLRRIQTQFDNGKVKKKSKQNSQGLLCPHDASQTKPNKANASQADSSIYNKDIYNIYNNKQTITNIAAGDPMVIEKLHNEILTKTDGLKSTPGAADHQQSIVRFEDLVTRLAHEQAAPIVNGEPVQVDKILDRYLNIFAAANNTAALKHLDRIFRLLDEACIEKKITNSYKYLIALFYNQAIIQEHDQEKKTDFSQRSYTSEEMNSLFDDLDEIKI